jgi:hypothetical protein
VLVAAGGWSSAIAPVVFGQPELELPTAVLLLSWYDKKSDNFEELLLVTLINPLSGSTLHLTSKIVWY